MTAELKPYSKMKDSGIAWLGMVPEHWKIVRQRYLCSTKTGTRDTVHQVDQGKYPFFVRSQTAVKIDTYSFDGEAVLTAGDGDIGKIFHYINGKFDFHQRVYKFSDFREVLGKFYFYYASANLHQEVLRLSAKSTVDSIRLPMLQNFPVVIPSVPEQVAIARYLDYVDVRVRRLTEAKRKLVGLLTEYKQAIVHRAVTRGLDPNVPLKNSDIEWLGMVPQHWEINRLGYCSSLIVPMRDKPERLDGNIPWVRIEDFSGQYLKGSKTNQGVSMETVTKMNLKVFPKGTVLCSCSCTMGATAIADTPLVSNQTFIGIVPKSNLKSEYVYWLMQVSKEHLTKIATGAIQQYLSRGDFSRLRISVPPISEQVAIVEYLDRTTAEIDTAVARAERQIELLNEYRTRLIADVVTGKLDVRDATLDPEERKN